MLLWHLVGISGLRYSFAWMAVWTHFWLTGISCHALPLSCVALLSPWTITVHCDCPHPDRHWELMLGWGVCILHKYEAAQLPFPWSTTAAFLNWVAVFSQNILVLRIFNSSMRSYKTWQKTHKNCWSTAFYWKKIYVWEKYVFNQL